MATATSASVAIRARRDRSAALSQMHKGHCQIGTVQQGSGSSIFISWSTSIWNRPNGCATSLNRAVSPHPSITDVLIKAAALALRGIRRSTSFSYGGAIRRYTQIDIGVAVAGGRWPERRS